MFMKGRLLTPVSDICCGQLTPAARIVARQPTARRSLNAITAVLVSPDDSICAMIRSPSATS